MTRYVKTERSIHFHRNCGHDGLLYGGGKVMPSGTECYVIMSKHPRGSPKWAPKRLLVGTCKDPVMFAWIDDDTETVSSVPTPEIKTEVMESGQHA